ncbi:tocopherol cyclase family protein [Janibacter sp. GXQ6167]|uniref:tocopherol cyclase family protein n=1 Tax=Janibacter sp. GXQ6167 TaxID=3240791 RepID=UPI003524ACF4
MPNPLRDLLTAYRRGGADLPFGDPLGTHGGAMEGYFWRISDPVSGRALVALIGINQGPKGAWATLGVADHPGGHLSIRAHEGAFADPHRLSVAAGDAFVADDARLTVDLGPDCRIDVRVSEPIRWPMRPYGGSSYFHSVPALNQYWHPWLLGGRADGTATLDGRTWQIVGAQVYGEKNWGREGFPDAWWWGQAQGFDEPAACVAFAGGEVHSGPLRTEVTGLVVRLPDGTILRQGNPVTSPVRARVGDETWSLRGHARRLGEDWTIDVEAQAPLSAAHVLPVPLPAEQRNTAGAIEHLGGTLAVVVRRGSRVVWSGRSNLAGLEHGGLDRAEAELRRRGAPMGAVSAPPSV